LSQKLNPKFYETKDPVSFSFKKDSESQYCA